MLTVDYDRLGVRPGDLLLDLGCGTGRHTREAVRRGARAVALDLRADDLQTAREGALAVRGDALALPFPDATFDHVIASEVLEHIPEDGAAIAELRRVLKPSGGLAVTVPRWFPERVCWALSDEYHSNPGGHVRIYRASELRAQLEAHGLQVLGGHHAHALHAPYWWVKCAVGPRDEQHPLPRLYHRFLVWDLMRRPRLTRTAERALNPVLGKSVVFYARA
ncbi:MAG TPA: class I SAM-dependent methyltransferase [Candidatus Dormibacteraeota bacterium]